MLAFPALALVYLRQRRTANRVFLAFTLCCGVAFLLNLAHQLEPRLEWLGPILDLVTGMFPALIVHLVAQEERSGSRWLPAGFYIGAGILAAFVAAFNAGWSRSDWGERLESAPATALGISAVTGLVLQLKSQRPSTRYRVWVRVLLLALLFTTAATGWPASPLFTLLPDYVLLSLFCVTLYYKERLVFFDLFLKRGAYFLAGSTAVVLIRPTFLPGMLMMALWLAGPWIYNAIAGAVDRIGLSRRYSFVEAERVFIAAVQAATSESDLETRATAAFEQIFEAPVEVSFDNSAAPLVKFGERRNGVPYLSGDLHLQQSLTRTLGVVLESVRVRELAGRAELKALRAQINPHFLFNALNAIAGLIHTNAAAAEETVEQLAEVFRYTLRKSEHEWVRLDEEIEFVRAYLRIEQARFGPRLAVEVSIDPTAATIQIPAMCIQPLVENAIKHGTSQIEGEGRVSVRAKLEDAALTIEVHDNGKGFAAARYPGPWPSTTDPHGLANVAARLSRYYGSSATLACANDHGARVTLRIPHASPDRR
jgi:signal transduction histidine kinase